MLGKGTDNYGVKTLTICGKVRGNSVGQYEKSRKVWNAWKQFIHQLGKKGAVKLRKSRTKVDKGTENMEEHSEK